MRAQFLTEVIVLSSVYSALLTAIFVSLDALDVAMTEAAVGVGVTTTLFLATLKLVGNNAESFKKLSYISLFLSLGVALLLVIGIAGLPPFGEAETPIHHISPFIFRKYVE